MKDVDQQAPPVNALPIVEIYDNRPMADSRDVARYFGKQHPHVLRDIRAITAECSRDFTQSNFGFRTEKQAHRTGATVVTYILMTFDGFMMLIMNYTGMIREKEAYIAEFNRRGREIEHLRSQLVADDLFGSIARIKSLCRGVLWCADQLEKTAYRIRAPELPFPGPLFAIAEIMPDPDPKKKRRPRGMKKAAKREGA